MNFTINFLNYSDIANEAYYQTILQFYIQLVSNPLLSASAAGFPQEGGLSPGHCLLGFSKSSGIFYSFSIVSLLFFFWLFFHLSDHSLSFYPISVSTFYFKCKDSESLCPQPLRFTHSLIYSVSSTTSSVLGSRDTLPNRWTGTDPSSLLV